MGTDDSNKKKKRILLLRDVKLIGLYVLGKSVKTQKKRNFEKKNRFSSCEKHKRKKYNIPKLGYHREENERFLKTEQINLGD